MLDDSMQGNWAEILKLHLINDAREVTDAKDKKADLFSLWGSNKMLLGHLRNNLISTIDSEPM